jgi:hypothetical protein
MWQNIFKRQYENWRWISIVSFSFYVHIHVNTFQPFKGSDVTYIWASTAQYWGHMAVNFANVFSILAALLIALPRYFIDFYAPERFNLRKLLFLFIIGALIMGTGFFWGNAHFFKFEPTLTRYISFLFNVIWMNLFLTSFPVGIAFLFIFTYFTGQSQQKASENQDKPIEEILHAKNVVVNFEKGTPQYKTPNEPKMLIFNDGTSKKRLQIALDKLFYITSAQNYIEIFYQNDSAEIKRTVLRNSLKTIETEMIDAAQLPLMRCHKAFIVNLEKVIDLSGTSHGGQFILENIDAPIPVSRQKYGEVKTMFHHLFVIS